MERSNAACQREEQRTGDPARYRGTNEVMKDHPAFGGEKWITSLKKLIRQEVFDSNDGLASFSILGNNYVLANRTLLNIK
jgi:hypothetical protein